MSIPCPHWSGGVRGGGRCSLGLFGGRPSLGTCHVCLGLPQRPVLPRERWAELHRRAFAWDGTGDVAAELEFIRTLAKGMGDCSCDNDWAALLRQMPPDLSSPAAYFAWSVAAHNAVNVRLGKPVVTVEAARAIHLG